MMRYVVALIAVVLTGCGSENEPGPTDVLGFHEDDVVIRARAELQVNVSEGRFEIRGNQSSTLPVNVTLATNTAMVVDTSQFKIPTISNAPLEFGTLEVTSLTDNQLNVCGTGGTTKCTKALLRVYTTGVAGAGLWNTADAYGMPLTATLTTPKTVGLNVAGAAVMQQISLAASKHVVALADFSTAPKYAFKSDFSNAGAGSYSTTIVLEYALAP